MKSKIINCRYQRKIVNIIKARDIEAFKKLIDDELDINAVTHVEGWSLLHYVASFCIREPMSLELAEFAQLLIVNDIDMDIKENAYKQTALDMLLGCSAGELMQLLAGVKEKIII